MNTSYSDSPQEIIAVVINLDKIFSLNFLNFNLNNITETFRSLFERSKNQNNFQSPSCEEGRRIEPKYCVKNKTKPPVCRVKKYLKCFE